MKMRLKNVLVMFAVTTLSGCATLPMERGYAESRALVESRLDAAPDWSSGNPADSNSSPAAVPEAPIDAAEAVRLAFAHSPRIREAFARIGLGRAELEDARRMENPRFGYAKLDPVSGGGTQISRSVSVGLGNLLLLPTRKRFAEGELERVQQAVAHELLGLAADVERAWYTSVSAAQVAAMRDLVARAAATSQTLAQRFFDAGNINRLQLAQEQAAATLARIEATRAAAEALQARVELASLIGLSASDPWTTRDRLPTPATTAWTAESLVELALQQRLDLSAARQQVTLREDSLGITRRWRWVGEVELGYEREHELDGGVMRGPSMSLQLPIFSQGQGAIERAQAELLEARAALDALALQVHNDARLGLDRLQVMQDIVERYRNALLPQRESIVADSQKEVNFMLIGVFELLLAKQAEYDAYQEYLEAVRDFWLARTELKRVVGGRLPGDDALAQPLIGVDEILPSAAAPAMDHSMHQSMDHGAASQPEMDHSMHQGMNHDAEARAPHAGHDMGQGESRGDSDKGSSDPHAGHDKGGGKPHAGEAARAADPHAGQNMKNGATPEDEPGDDHDTHQHSDGDQP